MAGGAHCAEPILWTGEYGLLRTGTDFYGLWAYGVVGAMCFGISGVYGSLEAFFFYAMCFCIIPGRLPALYPVPLSFLSFLSFTLLLPCALHNTFHVPACKNGIRVYIFS